MTRQKLTAWDRDALALRCPLCRRDAGQWCLTYLGKPAPRMHAARIAAARPHWTSHLGGTPPPHGKAKP